MAFAGASVGRSAAVFLLGAGRDRHEGRGRSAGCCWWSGLDPALAATQKPTAHAAAMPAARHRTRLSTPAGPVAYPALRVATTPAPAPSSVPAPRPSGLRAIVARASAGLWAR